MPHIQYFAQETKKVYHLEGMQHLSVHMFVCNYYEYALRETDSDRMLY